MSDETGVTAEGSRLIKNWMGAQERVRRATDEMTRALQELSEAQNALGSWICPSDIQSGEKIGVWYGDSIITCKYSTIGDQLYTLEVRNRGKSLNRI